MDLEDVLSVEEDGVGELEAILLPSLEVDTTVGVGCAVAVFTGSDGVAAAVGEVVVVSGVVDEAAVSIDMSCRNPPPFPPPPFFIRRRCEDVEDDGLRRRSSVFRLLLLTPNPPAPTTRARISLVGILDNWAFAGNASRANDSRIEETILIAATFIVPAPAIN